MDHQTSRSQKKRSATGSSSSSKSSNPTTTESASLRYFTALANKSTPYESPYAQDRDKRPPPPTTAALRASTISTTTRSSSAEVSYKPTSLPVRGVQSTHSSSSGGSLYTSSPSRQQQRAESPGTMSSSKTMSSVSHRFPSFVNFQIPLSSPDGRVFCHILHPRNNERFFVTFLYRRSRFLCVPSAKIPASVGNDMHRVRDDLIFLKPALS